MRDAEALRALLRRIDGRGYKAYKDIRGATRIDDRVTLFVDHVQGDPFAAPSRLRVRVARPVPADWRGSRRVAVEDWFARRVVTETGRGRVGGSGKSGRIEVDAPGQEVLERTVVRLLEDGIEVRLMAGLPARGRSVLGRQAEALLLEQIPSEVAAAVRTGDRDLEDLERFVETVENQQHLRAQLAPRGLVAFVADGAILPRSSGVSDAPLAGATPFVVPEGDPRAVELELRHPEGASVRGLGLPEGLSLIVGGGYHGKSTLLEAIQRSVYDHVPDDGRERVVTRGQAAKIRAEDGRRVEAVDISCFIGQLPSGRDTRRFSSEDASGSTSQAAGLVEAVEAGSDLVLMDEDTSATNFMIRDARMQALVHADDEPIVPFVDRVRALYEALGVSTILVMGGSGDYFRHADAVVQMKGYRPADVTERARALAGEDTRAPPPPLRAPEPRVPLPRGLDPARGKRDVQVDAPRDDELRYGEATLDLRALEQRVDRAQLRAIGLALHHARRFMDGRPLPEVLDALEGWLDDAGLDALGPRPGEHPGWLCRPRRQELAAALGRHRGLRCR
jgi:predicted ABC-class ATPase